MSVAILAQFVQSSAASQHLLPVIALFVTMTSKPEAALAAMRAARLLKFAGIKEEPAEELPPVVAVLLPPPPPPQRSGSSASMDVTGVDLFGAMKLEQRERAAVLFGHLEEPPRKAPTVLDSDSESQASVPSGQVDREWPDAQPYLGLAPPSPLPTRRDSRRRSSRAIPA